MNLKRRLEALEKECGIGDKELLPPLIVHFMIGWKYGEMTREEYEELNKITPEEQLEIDKEVARQRAEYPNTPFPPYVVWQKGEGILYDVMKPILDQRKS